MYIEPFISLYKTEQARALKLGDYRAMKEREKPQYPK